MRPNPSPAEDKGIFSVNCSRAGISPIVLYLPACLYIGRMMVDTESAYSLVAGLEATKLTLNGLEDATGIQREHRFNIQCVRRDCGHSRQKQDIHPEWARRCSWDLQG